jgi:hypothetical protein
MSSVMGNDVTWWKDRDEWMPGSDDDPPPRLDSEDEHNVSDEDIGDVAHDNSDDTDDSGLPNRGPDE